MYVEVQVLNGIALEAPADGIPSLPFVEVTVDDLVQATEPVPFDDGNSIWVANFGFPVEGPGTEFVGLAVRDANNGDKVIGRADVLLADLHEGNTVQLVMLDWLDDSTGEELWIEPDMEGPCLRIACTPHGFGLPQQEIEAQIISAENLPFISGRVPNPFVRIEFGDMTVHTTTMHTTHPVWDEKFMIPIVNSEDEEIHFQVRSDQVVIAEAIVLIDELRAQPNRLTLSLDYMVCGRTRGHVCVCVCVCVCGYPTCAPHT